MIEIGYAEQFLQDLLMEFGCWEEADDQLQELKDRLGIKPEVDL